MTARPRPRRRGVAVPAPGKYCRRHESATGPLALIMHPGELREMCPFCWFEVRPEHACTDRLCFCQLIRQAIASGEVWVRKGAPPLGGTYP